MGHVFDPATYLLTPQNVMVCAAAWAIIQMLSKGIPEVFTSKLALRLKPVASMVLCTALCFIPNVQPPDISAANKVLLGIVLGAFAGQVHKILKQTVLGHGAGREPKNRLEKAIS